MLDVIAGGPGLIAIGSTPVAWTSVDGITWTPILEADADSRTWGHMRGANIQGPHLVIVGSDGSGTVGQRDALVWVATLED